MFFFGFFRFFLDLDNFGYFLEFFGFFVELLRLLLQVTKVNTAHQKGPKIGKNSRSPPQELELGSRSGPYLSEMYLEQWCYVYSTLGCTLQCTT